MLFCAITCPREHPVILKSRRLRLAVLKKTTALPSNVERWKSALKGKHQLLFLHRIPRFPPAEMHVLIQPTQAKRKEKELAYSKTSSLFILGGSACCFLTDIFDPCIRCSQGLLDSLWLQISKNIYRVTRYVQVWQQESHTAVLCWVPRTVSHTRSLLSDRRYLVPTDWESFVRVQQRKTLSRRVQLLACPSSRRCLH